MAESIAIRRLAGVRVALAEGAEQQALAELLLAELGLAAPGLRLEHDGLGRPWLADREGAPLPAHVSFSRLGAGAEARLWAAAAEAQFLDGLGLDLAAPKDFGPPYPVARVFAPAELAAAHAMGLSGGDALALLWSLKEAGAKALGTGFSRIEPVDLVTRDFRPSRRGLACTIDARQTALPALAERLPEGWLALAALPADGATP